ncbi:MAG: ubiquinol oxidase subunit II [Gammaproteobacteria bacterium]|nr:ubiquinol oxidase subunit II [Gammaproteobacteria bacterium]
MLAIILSGCEWVVMEPSGDVARQEAQLIWISVLLMLIVIVPVIVLTLLFAWKYRESNRAADYDPDWHHSTTLEIIIWTVPLIIIMVLGGITFVATHRLDPYAPLSRIDANTPVTEETRTLEIEVVSLDWKWLFLYPEQGVAVVNELAAPVDRPIRFKITSGSVMNSFYIPALAGQIYAMSGMETLLHAVINEPGVYDGFSGNYSGHGFSHMYFKFHGMDDAGFDAWIEKVRANGGALTEDRYIELEEQTTKHPVVYFGSVQEDLYHDILNRCVAGRDVCIDEQMKHRSIDHKQQAQGQDAHEQQGHDQHAQK